MSTQERLISSPIRNKRLDGRGVSRYDQNITRQNVFLSCVSFRNRIMTIPKFYRYAEHQEKIFKLLSDCKSGSYADVLYKIIIDIDNKFIFVNGRNKRL